MLNRNIYYAWRNRHCNAKGYEPTAVQPAVIASLYILYILSLVVFVLANDMVLACLPIIRYEIKSDLS